MQRRERARTIVGAVVLATASSGLPGCAGLRPTPVPMRTISYGEPKQEGDRCLVVFLPGRYDLPDAFSRRGFPELLSSRVGNVRSVVADAHVGYYANKTVVQRLHEDVVEPARRRGVTRVWMVGVSMGGLGALGYAQRYPDRVEGIVLLAPYLGEPSVIKEILAAGGPRRWRPPAQVDTDDYTRDLWRSLRRYGSDDPPTTALFLGYGRDDRMAPADGMLAQLLPPDHVDVVEGGHDWQTWEGLFSYFLADGILDECSQ